MSAARGAGHARLTHVLRRAQLIAEKPTVINQYEAGKAIPNPAIINKLERALGTRLREAKPKKKKTASGRRR